MAFVDGPLVKLAFVAWLSAVASAQGSTYLVSALGGPGVHFTDLPPAVAVAVPGDVIVVRSGNYSPLSMSEGLAVIGIEDDVVTPAVSIFGLPANSTASVTGLACDQFTVTSCAGAVIVQHVSVRGPFSNSTTFQVTSSADVRLYRCEVRARSQFSNSTGRTALGVSGSRVEVVKSDLYGGDAGFYNSCSQGYVGKVGGPALDCSSGSRVHVALSNLTGGPGQDVLELCSSATGGNGGAGVRVRGSSSAIIAGVPTNWIRGGKYGAGLQYASPGSNGPSASVELGSTLRHSGATLGSYVSAPSGSVTLAIPPDPTLERIGSGEQGLPVTLRVHATASWLVQLGKGRKPIRLDDGCCVIEKLVAVLASWALGPVPSTNVIDKTIQISSGDPFGASYFFQAAATSPLESRRTNSVPIVVR